LIETSHVVREFGFDPEKLRQRYLEERDRRIRIDGDDQYIDVQGEFARFAADPFSHEAKDREPVDKEVAVLVLGGGIAGILTSVNLLQEGIEDFLIVEQAEDFGGTWYWNRYPGIRCDIESYVYMPLLEEVGTVPSEKYAHGVEIQRHLAAVGRKFGLYERALFRTVVVGVKWSDSGARWEIATRNGDRILAKHVIVSNAPLHLPKLPGIPGLQNFKGKSFHTSRWDYDYTGGDPYGNLTGLAGKRVALIGTGATGIQVLPHLAEAAEHLYVFQRTPSAVDARNNRVTDPDWFVNQLPNWQQRRIDNFISTLMGLGDQEDLVDDCWTSNAKLLRLLEKSPNPAIRDAPLEERMQLVDYIKMEQLRAMCAERVADPQTAEALKPWYNLFCKRPLFSDEYYPTFNRPNVTLVDTKGRGVERITDDAIFVDGVGYPADCIIFATGFRVAAYSHKSGGYELTGRDGVTMEQRWANGQRSVHGLMTAGFPNFHIVGTYSQASQSFNYSHVTRFQAGHAAKIIAKCRDHGIGIVEVTEEAEERWLRTLMEKRPDRAQFEAECTPGYFNNEGKADGAPTLLSNMYGGGPFEYIQILENWLSTGFEGDTVRTYERARGAAVQGARSAFPPAATRRK
jgi:cyclohexanone monooxygenase